MERADFDPTLDLTIEHIIDITPAEAWAGWTQPDHLVHWFTPAPWSTVEAVVDLRPGGIFRTVMASPDGERNEGDGCVLEVEENRRLVWTSAMGPNFRPVDFSDGGFPFTAVLTFTPANHGTLYRAHVMHATAAAKIEHENMGFADGWTAAMNQLVAHMASQR